MFAYYEEWSEMVKENRQACEITLRQYEEKVKKFPVCSHISVQWNMFKNFLSS